VVGLVGLLTAPAAAQLQLGGWQTAPVERRSSLPERPANDAAWRPIDAEPGPVFDLLDTRSPVIPHDRVVARGEVFACLGREITFSEQAATGRLAVTVAADDAAGLPGVSRVLADLPAVLRFDTAAGGYAVSVSPEPDGGVRVASAWGLAVPVGRAVGYVVDSDLDRTLGGPGDGVIVPGSRTVGPWPAAPPVELWSPDAAVEVAETGAGWAARPAVLPGGGGDRGLVAGWRFWMAHRQAAGLLPLVYDPALEAGMLKHAAYVDANDAYGHGEDPRKPGYSREGATAGMTSVIGGLKRSYVDGMDSQLRTLFHRRSCLAPELAGSAMVLHKTIFMASTRVHVAGPLRGKPLVYPAHGMVGVPCGFNIAGEVPMPAPGPREFNKLGFAVGVYLPQWRRRAALSGEVAFTLTRLSDRGRPTPVRGAVYHPGNVPDVRGVQRDYGGLVAFIPAAHLAPNRTYEAHLRAPIDGPAGRAIWFEYRWRFTTGDREPVGETRVRTFGR